MKDKNKVLKIFIFVLLLIIVGIVFYLITNNSTQKENNTNSNKEENISKVDLSKEYIYDNPKYDKFRVPYINLNSEDAKKFNSNIERYVDNNYTRLTEEFTYDSFVNKDIFSILIIITEDHTILANYNTFNINIKTGKEVSNQEMIDMKKLTKEELTNNIFSIYEESNKESLDLLKENKVGFGEEKDLTFYEANKSLLEKMDIEDFDMYFNEKKELVVLYKTYQFAGAESAEHLYNLDTKIIER